MAGTMAGASPAAKPSTMGTDPTVAGAPPAAKPSTMGTDPTVAGAPPAAKPSTMGTDPTVAGQPVARQPADLGEDRTIAGQPIPPPGELEPPRVAHISDAPPTVPQGKRRSSAPPSKRPGPAGVQSQPGPAPDPERPFEPGVVIGERFVIERHISSGGFGAVYKASDRYIDKHHVALKVLHFPAQSAEQREGALSELRLIASVPHPSVVQFKDYGWIAGCLWFAMPWYNGRTFEQMLGDGQGGRMAIARKEARPIFERVAYGLAAMHKVGVSHRDIKPENIFVAELDGFEGGLPVLLDLGIATEKSEIPRGFTLEFVAPETAAAYLGEAHHEVPGAADVYALALTLRVALEPESVPDIRDLDKLSILMKRSSEPIPLPRRRELAFLKPYFERWLNLDPAKRPTAEELATELRVLTQPEERRAARIRLLRRVAPFAVAAAALIAFLWMQVSQQKVEIKQQLDVIAQTRQDLEEEMEKGDADRQRASAELAELSQNLGSKSEQLTKTLSVAQDLEKQLNRTSVSRARLARALNVERDEHEALKGRHTELQASHAELGKQRDALNKERNELQRDGEKLRSQIEKLKEQEAGLRKDIEGLKSEMAAQEERIAKLEKKRDQFKAERDEAAAALEQTKQELEESTAALRKTEKALAEARKQSPDPEKEAAELQSTIDKLEADLKKANRKIKKLEKKTK